MKALLVRVAVVMSVLLASAAVSRGTGGGSIKDWMSAAEFERCGLAKLSPEELSALSRWVASAAAAPARAPAAPARALAAKVAGVAEVVALNVDSGKYHCRSCQAALRCTANCIEVPLADAQRRGVPCKLCGGSCP